MMRFAVIGDIHSNIYALCSVIENIEKWDVDFVICTGDLVGYSPFPNEVISILRRNKIISVQGNYDKAIGNSELICGCNYKDERLLELAGLSVAFTNMTISEKNRAYLKSLPQELILKSGRWKIRVVHGSPREINEPLYEDSDVLVEVLDNIPENILICGHTHLAYHRVISNKHLINCGTVGKPINGNPNAVYALVDITGEQVDVHFVEVEYNVDKAVEAIEEAKGLPKEFAIMIRNAVSL